MAFVQVFPVVATIDTFLQLFRVIYYENSRELDTRAGNPNRFGHPVQK